METKWDEINAQKRMDILKGQTANQSWNLLLSMQPQIDKGKENKSINGLLEDYEAIYKKLLQHNVKMILGRELKIEEKAIEDSKLVKIGVAWKDKKFQDKKLSCKHDDTDSYISVDIDKLEKTDDGFIYETDQERLILKEIPEDKRHSEKAPHYEIYKEE